MIPVIKTLGKKYYPARSLNSYLARYETYKLGWFFHEGPLSSVYPVGDIRRHRFMNYDFASFASQAVSAGNVDFVIWHANQEIGSTYFPSQVQYNGGVSHAYNGQTVPVYGFDYIISDPSAAALGVDENEMDNFLDAFNAVSIDCGIYYCIGKNVNFRTDLNVAAASNSSSTALSNYYSTYVDYVTAQVIELVNLYGPKIKFLWLDLSLYFPTTYQRQFYDNVKKVAKNILLVVNVPAITASNTGGLRTIRPDGTKSGYTDALTYNGDNIHFFPEDVLSREFHSLPSLESEWDNVQSSNGGSYYLPSELVYSGLYRIDAQSNEQVQYQWLDANDPVWNGQQINQVYSQAQFQQYYDYAKTRNASFACNVPVKQDGTLDATYMSRLQNLVL